MTEFNKRLENSTAHIRENQQQKKNAVDAAAQNQRASEMARELAMHQAHRIALRLSDRCREVLDKIRTKVPGGWGREFNPSNDEFAGWTFEFGETEYLALKIHFDERGVRLSAEARCRGVGTVYTQDSKVFDAAKFDEEEAQVWIDSHALESYEAFGQNAEAIRNPQPIATFNAGDRK